MPEQNQPQRNRQAQEQRPGRFGAPIHEPVRLKDIQHTCRRIIRHAKSLKKRGYSAGGDHARFCGEFQTYLDYLFTIDKKEFRLPFCPLLTMSDIRAGLVAVAEEWGSGPTDNVTLQQIKYRSLSLAIVGHSDPLKSINGDPMVVIGARALQFDRYVSHLNAMSGGANAILSSVLHEVVPVILSKRDKALLAKAIRRMEDNFPRKVKGKIYRGPKVEDEYDATPTPIRYDEKHDLKTVLKNLTTYLNKKIGNPSRFLGNEEKRKVMRALKRVADEAFDIKARNEHFFKRNTEDSDVLLKTYLNAVILFSHGKFEEGCRRLEDLILDCWQAVRTRRGNRPDSDIHG